MTTHWFTLRLDGPNADSDEFAEALYSDGRDCILATTDGVVRAAFHRDAVTLREAILSAISSIHKADLSVRVVALETEGGHTIDEAFAA